MGDNVDPSDLNARRVSFKQRFNTLGSSAKQKLGVLAHKLQRNKQEAKQKESGHQYRNVLTSLDDEALIDVDDVAPIEVRQRTIGEPIRLPSCSNHRNQTNRFEQRHILL